MITIDQALAAMRDANPAVDDRALPDSAWSTADLLLEIARRTDMDTQEITTVEPVQQPARKRRGPLVALATAATVLVAGAVFVFASLAGSDTPDAAATDLEVAMDFFGRYDAGDVAGYEALIDRDATWGPEDEPEEGFGFKKGKFFESEYIRGLNAGASHYIVVTGAVARTTCTPADPQLRCDRAITSALNPGAVSQSSYLLTINGGLIVDAIWSGDEPPPASDTFGWSAYRLWLMDNRPDEFEQLFEGGARMILDTPEARELHQQYVAEFLAETGGA